MSSTLQSKELFGGAITARLPSQFADVSDIRQVPDNQEVYLESNGFTSLTFDITERVSHLSSDKEALEYHFTDVVAEEDRKEILSIHEGVKLPNFPADTPILSLVAGITPPPNANPRPLTPESTTLYLTLIRLVEQTTDIEISLNVPSIPGSPSSQSKPEVQEMIAKIVASFEIKDWSLFDG